MKRVIAFFLTIVITYISIGSVHAEEKAESLVEANESSELVDTYIKDYYEFLDIYSQAECPIVTLAAQPSVPKDSAGVKYGVTVEGKENVILIEENNSVAGYTINVGESGLYSLRLEYLLKMENSLNARFDLYINGEIQHKSLLMLELPLRYKNLTAIRTDIRGNDIRPEKTEIKDWSVWSINDPGVETRGAMLIYLEQGENLIEIRASLGGTVLGRLEAYNVEKKQSYTEYRIHNDSRSNNAPEDYFWIRQAEECGETSDSVLYPTYDRSSAATTPNDPIKLKLNTIGQNSWNKPGQWIEWEIEVPQDGYYEIGARVRQNQLRGFFSTRSISIDGEVLFDELSGIQFPYEMGWYVDTFGDDEDYLFYLTKGKHTLRLQATLGTVSESIIELDKLTLEMNTLYRNIIMVTGLSIDIYRDYMLEQQVPNLIEKLENIRDRLSLQMKTLASLGIKGGSDAVVIDKLIFQIDSFIEKPETIPQRVSDFLENISSMSAWALSMKNQPLEIDYIYVKSPSVEEPKAGGGFFSQLVFRTRALIGSFVEDYSSLAGMGTDAEITQTINAWVALGRDQGQVIKDLSENDFTLKTNIAVNISLMQTGLNEAIAAGRGPDIALFTGDVVNLASREALVDISTYKDFNKVTERFSKNTLTPYKYSGGIYALPLEQNVMMMFYRIDVFNELGLKPPKTWDEFDKVLTTLQKNRLSAGLYAGTSTVGDTSIFQILLYQSGGALFNEDLSKMLLDSDDCYKAFKKWTDYYKKYSLLTEFNFYNRFRSGEMPIGIQSQGMYAQLKLAAPELDGLWKMLPIPQTVLPDGSRSDLTIAGVSPAIILKNEHEEACMRYLDWFTSAETQVDYGREVENILGMGARYNSANLQAVAQLNWAPEEGKLIASQMEKSYITPAIPASYYVGRNLTNAFRKVVISGYTPRESLLIYNEIINSEITRKNNELMRRAGKAQ